MLACVHVHRLFSHPVKSEPQQERRNSPQQGGKTATQEHTLTAMSSQQQ